ncbi:MAG: protein-L-isoaspartate(D-aspartate) O-methyltransferase [Candidatus Cloacimonetes bacterium]|jgi:protein-L-isoaspartate(D-aspartate) O-methyltransferase|nr:protein-L-isoaspartate(D-aspartate) O-methyltransferase [Candidatus Cloacimonadota bacterium]MDY0337436.1 protein-L-isoaspartate(D-aspartate) O-methyltransferase [Candidatus Cloacimonadaceae bacterium]MCB5269182.1 protein-L-isoaspartate(D-aspartate) O-methyltransferase [Candidatus Cloacimonadota bacterium]MCK9334642.1 protein-L-isoaspartate(D-aspartate) O-methyltransferase [Candidatus Cloacimonadota bacterium]MDD2544560.1 protein-L-isoaspartate(D-aspartate) O-methyltransferase [Candidatus Cl
MRYEDQRKLLVQDLHQRGIVDEVVLQAFARIPREDYVLKEYKEYSYRNQPLPIQSEQTISQPLMIALMMSKLHLKSSDRVLEIGTGSGYQSALLATIVAELCTVEVLDNLSLGAQKVLKAAGFRNIHFRIGDGWRGWEKAYPPHKDFDKIIVSAAADCIPSRLCEQIAEGGIMVVPVGGSSGQILNVVKRQNGELIVEQDVPCAFVPLVHQGGR